MSFNAPTPALFITALFALSRGAHAGNSTSISDILLPKPKVGDGPVGEIQCYALPYGAIGIISHLLTYWTIAWMAVGRVPLWPLHRMKTYGFDMFLAGLALCTCIPIASITMHRCRLSWHFLLICIWKLVTSVSLSCVTLHRCFIIRREKKQGRHNGSPQEMQHLQSNQHTSYTPYRQSGYHPIAPSQVAQPSAQDFSPLYWLILYIIGTIVGMVGLCSLLYTTFRHDRQIRNLTYGFAAAMLILTILVAIYWFKFHLSAEDGGRKRLCMAYSDTVYRSSIAFIATFGFFSALYSDLVLGTIANNLFGLPSQDFVPLYWAWFVAKRLPLLSF